MQYYITVSSNELWHWNRSMHVCTYMHARKHLHACKYTHVCNPACMNPLKHLYTADIHNHKYGYALHTPGYCHTFNHKRRCARTHAITTHAQAQKHAQVPTPTSTDHTSHITCIVMHSVLPLLPSQDGILSHENFILLNSVLRVLLTFYCFATFLSFNGVEKNN